jgi:hypothetical protein|tara:strand:- start:838 stop:1095 length:258 start_codon:yes stop_codon:yes gene_type:complete
MTSMNTTLRGITYVSVWVVIWGTVASLMDWMLLTGEVYETGTSGQAVTFIGYGAATVVMATRYAGRFLASGDQQSSDRTESTDQQ